jgi:hypothetical protein
MPRDETRGFLFLTMAWPKNVDCAEKVGFNIAVLQILRMRFKGAV